MSRYNPQTKEKVSSKTENQTKEPAMYRVLLHNDDYTTMEFVVEVLMLVFGKRADDAASIMMNVHKKGVGVCGIYSLQIAETKVETVHAMARENGHPLKCSMDKV